MKTISLPGLARALLTLINAFQTLIRTQNKSANFDESVFFLAIALLGNNLFDFRNAYREDSFFHQRC